MVKSNALSLVVWNSKTGEVKNARYSNKGNSKNEVTQFIEKNFPDLKVLHIFNGNTPSKSYRSLPYDNRLNGEDTRLTN